MFVESFPVGPLQCNCSIIGCKETGEAAVIDPGGDVEHILEILKKNGLKVKYLLHTHAHFDHILGTKAMRQATNAKICLHKKDEPMYLNLDKQCALFGFPSDDVLPIDEYLNDDEELEIGKIKTSVIHTPGHSPGSTCFRVADKESILFSGDTLFQGSIGRTDLWGGSFEDIIKSIKSRLLPLEDSTRVVAGHGPDTSIWKEKKLNPYLD
jgi:glyoxylase-like metal-dependent hydrolase (beta-lactamase superfamily II)